ncbi:sugar phosphate isomerase/epimerase family protein [Streptomyces sp. C36]|uniref:sugar phosphate isomerase/epimerase family protein n=1 Tax=Streptomyces sp. C36 TaxID=3237122 RepID=UPI0034C6AB1E
MTADGHRPPAVGLTDWRLPVTGPDALALARDLGADGVQLDLGGPGRAPLLDAPGTLDAVREAAAATGVRVLGLAANTLNDIGLTAPAGGADAVRVRAVLTRLLDAASAVGAPLVFVPSFRRSAIEDGAALRRTAEVLAPAAAEAAARGLLLANENVLDGARAAELVERVGSPAFRLLLDTHNPRAAGVDVPELLAAAGRHFADQIHLKDSAEPAAATAPMGGDGLIRRTLAALVRHRVPVRALVLENDYRDGDRARLAADLAWARRQAARPTLAPEAFPAHTDEVEA